MFCLVIPVRLIISSALEEQVLLKEELLIQQVIGYRELQLRIGGRKLFFMAGPFYAAAPDQHGQGCIFYSAW